MTEKVLNTNKTEVQHQPSPLIRLAKFIRRELFHPSEYPHTKWWAMIKRQLIK